MKKTVLLAGMLCATLLTRAQLFKRLADRVKQTTEQNVSQKVDQQVNKTIDGAVTGKKRLANKDADAARSGKNTDDSKSPTQSSNGNSKSASLKSYSKFDFIPGEKILAAEDFSQDAIGDFPDRWNTNSTGEIMNVEGRPGKWLSLSKDGVFMPEFINSLPDNFTLEFELMCNPSYGYYSTGFYLYMAELKNRKEFHQYKMYSPYNRQAVEVWMHPQDAVGTRGHTGTRLWSAGNGDNKNEASTAQFFGKTNNYIKVSVWRQKQRLRVYLNEEKVWDLPRAFDAAHAYNTILFMTGSTREAEDRFLISNLRLAVGAPDTRNKLITEGKFVTHGILFDVNSDRIRPESYGTLKDIAGVLAENSSVKVKIVGHTDSDGDDASNVTLSKRRAEAVKTALSKEFSIDAARMETDGKGESQPADKNNTTTGKANNRRVEFIKL